MRELVRNLALTGAVVTDASGRPLDERPLLGAGPDFQMSVVASANEALHARILGALDVAMSGISGMSRGA